VDSRQIGSNRLASEKDAFHALGHHLQIALVIGEYGFIQAGIGFVGRAKLVDSAMGTRAI